MIFQYSPFFLPLFFSAVITGLLAYIGVRNRTSPVAWPFAILMAAVTLWTAAYAVQLIFSDLLTNLLLTVVEYLGIVIVPVAWLLVVLYYTGRMQYVTGRNVALLLIVPVMIVVLVATNSLHHLFYSAVIPRTIGGSVLWVFFRGPLFWLHAAYAYLLLLISLILLASRYSGAPKIYRWQILILGIAACIPVLVNLLYLASIDPVPGLDLTPFTFTMVGVIIAMGLFRYQLFLTLPVAYPQVFSAVSDGIIVADTRDRIVDLNPAARQITGSPEDAIGRSLTSCFPQLSRFTEGTGHGADTYGEVMIPRNGTARYYDVVYQHFSVAGQDPTGHLFILSDITDRRLALDALASAHKKLNLLSSVTRHDMMNKVTGLMVYLDLMKNQNNPEMNAVYLQRIDEIARMIQDEIAFTRDYQEMGVKSPVWQDLSACLAHAKSQVDIGTIRVTEDCTGVEVYADPLLIKVFINLLENAVRHGGDHLDFVRFSHRRAGDSLVVTCEDNGTGIAESEKGRLFSRGYGRHTGLGLFLSREILNTTGLAIREDGLPGGGARFEITVPAGHFRFSGREYR
ncbi:histidine kinase N-terminal 7TM domain-containing protein [Methanoregula sp.]|uniref:histidine kinase N-terminal 7TM domain-containing protein n=1 Tax=Methanoregula sp. TaxID=2052170 RepID=UPI002C72F9DB|nr:histidine kinase N-terminal 7TM domain-containing protein [Methanoregula sp.]HVP97335.1 histidine kinase N-terminal 7TM domain-containing protein [Methanoregula sp.]